MENAQKTKTMVTANIRTRRKSTGTGRTLQVSTQRWSLKKMEEQREKRENIKDRKNVQYAKKLNSGEREISKEVKIEVY